jgi:hypothetical protein
MMMLQQIVCVCVCVVCACEVCTCAHVNMCMRVFAVNHSRSLLLGDLSIRLRASSRGDMNHF